MTSFAFLIASALKNLPSSLISGTAAVATRPANSQAASTMGIRANRAIRIMVIDLLRIGRTGYYRERKRLSIIIVKGRTKKGRDGSERASWVGEELNFGTNREEHALNTPPSGPPPQQSPPVPP